MQNLFSYPLYVEDMGSGAKLYKLEATTKQLAYITEVLKVDGVKSFKAEIEVKFSRKIHRIDVRGKII